MERVFDMKRICLAACLLLMAAQIGQTNAQVSTFRWGNVAIGGGGFVSAIVADPNERDLFYARTDVGGAYRWDNAASKWVSIMDWVDASERGLLGVEAIAVDPNRAGTVYMVAGTSYWNDGRSAFLRSSDRGNTWEVIYTWDPDGAKGPAASRFGAHGNGMGRGNGEALAVDPNNSNIMFYGSKNKGLFKSTNNGTTWSKVTGFTTAAGSDTTWNGSGFSFVAFAPQASLALPPTTPNVIYAGFLRADNNVFRSTDGGTTWSVIPNRPTPATRGGYAPPLMPQRIAITPDGGTLYITFGDGAGPHTMQWDEGWGPINDWFNRGAVLKYDVAGGTWSDVSPENFVDPGDNTNYDSPSEYVACYSGVSVNRSNPQEIIVSSVGYRGPQFWKSGSTWYDQWGSNIYHSKDGGQSWVPSFQYYWIEGGNYPTTELMSENGIGWMFNSSIHWSGSVVFDPFDAQNVWVTSGNGVFATSNMGDYTIDSSESWNIKVNQNTAWRVMSHGIEETVPGEVVSIPGGPLVSVILDYDGFRHNNIAQYPSNRHQTNVSGSNVSLGNTRALAFAPKSGRLVKATDTRVHEGQYNDVPISPLQFSNDTGRTWTAQSYENDGLGDSYGGALSVAISADGQAVLLTPLGVWEEVSPDNAVEIDQPVRRYANSAWSAVSGVDGAYIVGDPENASVFYAYNRKSGKFFKSADKGAAFAEVSSPGASNFQKFRLVPDKEGDIWLPLTDGGLARSTNGGTDFGKISTVSYCEAVGFGKAAEGKAFPTVFIFGKVGDVAGVFMSIDEGATWWRANDDAHEYGGLANGEFVAGDMNVYGRVYMSTAGRGIVYGDISGISSIGGRGVVRGAAAASAIKLRGASLSIKTDAKVTHHIRVFDLKGRTVYKRIVMGSAAVTMNRVLPKGNYVLSVRRDGKDVYRNKLRIVK